MTQYASPDLIPEFAYNGRDIATDPRWPETGAPDLAAYTRWAGAICGMACLRMALLRRDGTAPHLFALLDGALKYGAYVEEEGGTIRGMIYAPFVEYVKAEHGLEAEVHGQLPVGNLLALLRAGSTVIASVHKEIRNPTAPPPGRGGHLVYVTAHAGGAVHLRNPSGHTAKALKAAVPVELFAGFYAERGVSIT
ncbi:peptidase [Streptomyces nojiriensis]|uniref:peptidase n=1 Tax=Streptomyces nojiriensis TaxID=66374 RepID=UPI0036DDE5C5